MIARALLIVRIGAVGLLLASQSSAATFTVNTNVDAVDARPGDGVCATSAGQCTVRAAVQETNALVGADTIRIPPGSYGLTIGGSQEDAGATGDLDVTSSVFIVGAGAELTTVSAANNDRIFDVLPGATDVVIARCQLRGGTAAAEDGGALRLVTPTDQRSEQYRRIALHEMKFAGNRARRGGAIAVIGDEQYRAHLFIRSTSFESNVATAEGGAVSADHVQSLDVDLSQFTDNRALDGGAISIVWSVLMTVARSTLERNTAIGRGGAIHVDGYVDQAQIAQSTIVRNRAATGGAVYACCQSYAVQPPYAGWTTRMGISLSTISHNEGTTAGAIASDTYTFLLANSIADNLSSNPGALQVRSTIYSLIGNVLSNAGGNCGSNTSAKGAYQNVISDGSCTGALAAQNLIGADPLLMPLADNGGPTRTRALQPGSPAVDFVTWRGVTVDQRGVLRPSGAASDAGSYEIGNARPVATIVELIVSPNPAPMGAPIVLTTLLNGNVSWSQAVQYFDGDQLIGYGDAAGKLIVRDLEPGVHPLRAVFPGTDLRYETATSNVVNVVVVAGALPAQVPAASPLVIGALIALLGLAGFMTAARVA